MDALLPWQLVRVSGPSMVPTLATGDRVLVRHSARIRPGDVVLAEFADLPGQFVIKRAVRLTPGGWWLASDNAAAGGDSRTHGAGRVLARAVLRLPARGRPRRIARAR
jgi:phage repressor protein C with HTH and peptisase S24 domain